MEIKEINAEINRSSCLNIFYIFVKQHFCFFSIFISAFLYLYVYESFFCPPYSNTVMTSSALNQWEEAFMWWSVSCLNAASVFLLCLQKLVKLPTRSGSTGNYATVKEACECESRCFQRWRPCERLFVKRSPWPNLLNIYHNVSPQILSHDLTCDLRNHQTWRQLCSRQNKSWQSHI